MAKPKILERKKIELSEQQLKMLKSGWGSETAETTITESITYISDGLKVKGYASYPKNPKGKIPCIIWNRGGYKDKGAIDLFTASGMFGQIASWGYLVLASQYRGNSGGEGEEELGGGDVNDILNLIPLADEFEFADRNNWGMEGWSRGGMMTFLALMKNPSFKCAVLSGAITNIKHYADENPKTKEFYKTIWGEKNYSSFIEDRTIINKVEKLPQIPYLIMHGGNDETVPAHQSIEFAKKLAGMNYPLRFILFENGDHFLKTHRKETEQLRKFWFDKYLKSSP